MAKLIEPPATGTRFGRLAVTDSFRGDDQRWRCVCVCDCGNTKTVRLKELKNGSVQSCRCLMVEGNRSRFVTHGMTGSPLYLIWTQMRQRCENVANDDFDHYGGRGVAVCARWQSFENFFEDMSGSYAEGLTIDRIDNDGDYTLKNCQWLTRSAHARRTNLERWNRIRRLGLKIGQRFSLSVIGRDEACAAHLETLSPTTNNQNPLTAG